MDDEVEEVALRDDARWRRGRIVVPAHARAIVLFVHGGGSGGRSSLRDRYVASAMHEVGLATGHFDLLSRSEAISADPLVEVVTLARRLDAAACHVRDHESTTGLPVAVFGGGTGAAAALLAVGGGLAAAAIVCRGGRLDLARRDAAIVRVPTLLLVGDRDPVGVEHGRRLDARMRCEHRLDVIEGATALFETPEALADVALRSRRWIVDHLPAS